MKDLQNKIIAARLQETNQLEKRYDGLHLLMQGLAALIWISVGVYLWVF